MSERPTWDQYGLALASTAAIRGDCKRRKVGAIILDTDHRVVAAGYNGSPPGGPSCLAGMCPRAFSNVAPGSQYSAGSGRCIATHAEINALEDCTRKFGEQGAAEHLQGATIYITDEPCEWCWQAIADSGIQRIVWPQGECDGLFY